MTRFVLAAPAPLAVLALACLSGLACGGDEGRGGVHAPCTRQRDCESPLQCAAGVCVKDTASSSADAAVTHARDGSAD